MKASRSCSGAARSWSRASRPCRAGEILASDRKGTARHPDGQPACCRLAIELLTSAEGGYWAFVAACLIGVLPVAKRPFKALRMGQPFTIESLMTIAAGGDLLIGAAEEAVSRFESFPAMSEWGWSSVHSFRSPNVAVSASPKPFCNAGNGLVLLLR